MSDCSVERGYTALAVVERAHAVQLAAGTAVGHVDVLDITDASLSASLLAAPQDKVCEQRGSSQATRFLLL